ncbi:MAG: hypothetical protein A2Y62_16275 [Candidatus Fischerbacteria bacterium RBG_13_37_8]|uniref:DUF362 domain-containing protein n=1 Tax=Candidatus Fischerbacteria bacterium RBG_13_37_8 TaxID=1817863 RepID=A0A1F5VVR2_9BACT|nr:MAG: hypothetical protein A2Y62_16275 [Candidatus Fischerbacteria bacterium RBG_13_37_8]
MPKLVAKAGSIISVATGEDPYMITKKAIEAYGGMQRYINRGDIVSLKPNIGWDRIPQQAANTNPLVIKALVEMCLQAGAKEVRVGDVPCVEANRSYQRSGIAQAAEEAGGKIIMPEERYMKEINIKGQFIKNWPVFVPLLEVDKIINVPIVKHHSLTLTTLGMKNWFGIISGARNQLHQQVHEAIVDLALFVRPVLTVVDGFRILTRNGPQGGSPAFVSEKKTVAISTDPVAADAFGAKLLGLNPTQLRFLILAQEAGLGSIVSSQIDAA